MQKPGEPLLQQLSRRTPLYHRDIPFVLLWAQKAGCTFLLKWYLWQLDLLDDAIAYGQQRQGLAVHRYENEVFKARRCYVRRMARRIKRGIPIVNFVRCPYERVFSSFMHINNRHFARIIDTQSHPPGLRLRARILHDLYGENTALSKPISFANYIHWLAAQNMATLDPHHRPQTTALYSLPQVEHFRLEHADAAFDKIEARFALRGSRKQRKNFRNNDHHIPKTDVDTQEALDYLKSGVQLRRPRDFAQPRINRAVLQCSPYAVLIERLFAHDIKLYDSIAKE